jgi:broad specificity phosphatase PhoE
MIGQTVGIPPEPLDLIVEQDFGSLEGKRIKPNSGIFLTLRMILRSKIPLGSDGETLNEIYQRAVKFLSLINQYQPKGKVVAVSHSGFINVLLRKITGRRLGYYPIKPASIIEIELDGNHQGRILTPLEVIYLPKKM